MRVTILCPEHKVQAFAPFLTCKALTAAEEVHFPAIRWRDAAGVRFAAASFEGGDDAAAYWAARPAPPDWADATLEEMALAQACHATLNLIGGEAEIGPAPTDRLSVIFGRSGGDVLDLSGLRQDLPTDI